MAEVISVDRLIQLLTEARARGGKFAWIDRERLRIGASLGDTEMSVSLGSESLINEDAEASTRSPDARTAERLAGSVAAPSEDRRAPDALPPQWKLPAFAGRATGSYRLALEGEIYAARSQKELLLIGLCAIERARPGTLAKLSADKTRTKRAVAKERSALNDNPEIAERFSQEIEGGWWVLTNNSYAETEKFLRRAGFHAGLKVDVRKLA